MSDPKKAQLIQEFIAPCGAILTERVAVLASVYSSVMVGERGYTDYTAQLARAAVHDFLSLMDERGTTS